MMIIGVDYHPSFQAMAFLMEETGECGEQELNSDGEAERFYRNLRLSDQALGRHRVPWPCGSGLCSLSNNETLGRKGNQKESKSVL